MTDPHAPVRDADEPAALPPRLARRGARGRIPWGMLALESFFTVVAILLALAADDWRQQREERELVDGALRTFGAELAENRRRMGEVLPYHRALRTAVARAGADSSGRVYRSPSDVYPEWQGLRPAFITHAAWQSAIAMGALRHVPPETLRELSLVYEYQAKLDALNSSMYAVLLDPAMAGAADFRIPARILSVYLTDVVAMERELTGIYDQLLAKLRQEAAG